MQSQIATASKQKTLNIFVEGFKFILFSTTLELTERWLSGVEA
jgi:hypothetical protein